MSSEGQQCFCVLLADFLHAAFIRCLQTDKWQSEQSAKVHDVPTEMLFLGR